MVVVILNDQEVAAFSNPLRCDRLHAASIPPNHILMAKKLLPFWLLILLPLAARLKPHPAIQSRAA